MTLEEFEKLSEGERIDCVQSMLNYLESEGVVAKMPNGNYRAKTKQEIQQEIQDILNS
jgi:hypothetical protein